MGRPRVLAQGGRRFVTGSPARGEVWWCEMAEVGRRPVVVLSRDVAIPDSDPIPRRSAVNLDSVESVSTAVLVSRVGQLSDARMRAVCAALAVAVDCSDVR